MRSVRPPADLPSQEQQVLNLAESLRMLRARDVTAHGIPTVTLTRLVQSGQLERLARGLYGLPGASVSEHRSLAEACARVPRAVVCLLSALRFHDIGTQAPFEVWLAIPQRTVAPKLDRPALRIVHMSENSLNEGVALYDIDGVQVPVFSAAKTVADCFKFRHKIGLDVALEALRDGWAQRKFTMDELWTHAAVNRMTNVMRPYIEAITA
jgi:predicted transcriptional regulator of viral defense system